MSNDRDSRGGILFTAALTHAMVRYPAVHWAVMILLLPVYVILILGCFSEGGFLEVLGWLLTVGCVCKYGGGLLRLFIGAFR